MNISLSQFVSPQQYLSALLQTYGPTNLHMNSNLFRDLPFRRILFILGKVNVDLYSTSSWVNAPLRRSGSLWHASLGDITILHAHPGLLISQYWYWYKYWRYFLPRCMECRRGLAIMSVCPSVKRVICDKTKESYARILIPHKSPFILVLWQEEWLVISVRAKMIGRDDSFYLKFWVTVTALERNRRFSIYFR